MPLLTFGMTWVGYALLTWGVATVRGCNVNFTQVAWPGKFVGCNPDSSSGTSTSASNKSATTASNQTAAETAPPKGSAQAKVGGAGAIGGVGSVAPAQSGLPPGFLGRG